MENLVTVTQAAKELGMSPTAVRTRMKRNLFQPAIGHVFPSLTGKGYSFYIYRTMLDKYLGKE